MSRSLASKRHRQFAKEIGELNGSRLPADLIAEMKEAGSWAAWCKCCDQAVSNTGPDWATSPVLAIKKAILALKAFQALEPE